MQLAWKIIDREYLRFLREGIDSRIPRDDYGEDKIKPFFGELFHTGQFAYVTQVSHPQQRHNAMKQNFDFRKIYNPKDGALIAVVNLNYMFPVPSGLMCDLEYSNISSFRTFKTPEGKSRYIDLLKIEIEQINATNISQAARRLYNLKKEYPDSPISKRCLDFASLEEFATSYIK